MRGFLSLDPDSATRERLIALQNRLRDALTRQGVHFAEPERLAPTLLAWPFGRNDELEEAATLLRGVSAPCVLAKPMEGRPNNDRPAEIGCEILGLEELQAQLFERLRATLDPDQLKESFVRLVRISPPSRKVGVALRGSGLLGSGIGDFVPAALTLWRQSPQGFEPCRTLSIADGRS